MAKPTSLPRWAETAAGTPSAEIVQPNSARKDAGFSNTAGDIPTGGEFNWVLNTILAWCKYLNTITAEALTWTPRQTFSGGITIPVGQVDAATAGANRQYVDDSVVAEGVTRAAGDAALDVRVDALEALDHEGRITTLETEATAQYAALICNPALASFIESGGDHSVVKVNNVVVLKGRFHNLTIGTPGIKAAGTMLGTIPAGFRPTNRMGSAELYPAILWSSGTPAPVFAQITHAAGEISLPYDAMPIESLLDIGATWYAGP